MGVSMKFILNHPIMLVGFKEVASIILRKLGTLVLGYDGLTMCDPHVQGICE